MSDKKKSFLITGASGFVGHHLVSYLSNLGHEVHAVYRKTLPVSLPNVLPVSCEMSKDTDYEAMLRGIDVVVHLAWSHPDVQPENDSNYKIAQNFIKQIEKSKVEKVIFLSVVGASSEAKNQFIAEKYRVENLFINSEIPFVTVLRTNLLYGGDSSQDRFTKYILNQPRISFLSFIPNANRKLSLVNIGDLLQIIERQIFEEVKSCRQVIEVSGKKEEELADISKLIYDKFTKKKRLIITGPVAKAVSKVNEKRKNYNLNNNDLKDLLSIPLKPDDSMFL